MKKILVFTGSNHNTSINHQLAMFAATLVKRSEAKVLDIRNWNIPVYSINMDPNETPEEIMGLISQIKEYDGFIIASPEHNGGVSAFLKNILDWLSRRSEKIFENKPTTLLSTSPGKTGGATNLDYLKRSLQYQGANVINTFSLPSFFHNFKSETMDMTYLPELKISITQLEETLDEQ